MSIEILYWVRSICMTITMLSTFGVLLTIFALSTLVEKGGEPSLVKKLAIALVVLTLVFVITPPIKTFNVLIEQAKQGACTTSVHKIEVEK